MPLFSTFVDRLGLSPELRRLEAGIRMYRKLIIIGFLLILLVRVESKSTLIRTFLKFAEGDSPDHVTQAAPSPSPASSIGLNSSGDGPVNFGGQRDGNPKEDPIDKITDEGCERSLSKWCQDLNLTACLPSAESGPQGSFLVVQNDEDNLLQVYMTILPQNISFEAIELERHQAKKMNISAVVGGTPSIVLNTGHGDCMIQMGSPTPEANFSGPIPSGSTNVDRVHGAYLLVSIVLIAGGAWACFKLRKREQRHLDGVPYQELEMGHTESLSAVNFETAEGWDQDWDDEWDEENAVMSPGRKNLSNGQANGLASRHSNGPDGWENNQDE